MNTKSFTYSDDALRRAASIAAINARVALAMTTRRAQVVEMLLADVDANGYVSVSDREMGSDMPAIMPDLMKRGVIDVKVIDHPARGYRMKIREFIITRASRA